MKKKFDLMLLSDNYGVISKVGNQCFVGEKADRSDAKTYHIYFVSEDKLNEGDWCISNLNTLVRFGKLFDDALYSKVIASTNEDLKNIPKISKSFIDKYINNPNIDEVTLKIKNGVIKVDENNNVVMAGDKIYTEDEVESLIELAFACCSAHATDKNYNVKADCESWINTYLN